MKKLIDKLEKECLIGLKDAGYGGWQTGFRDAIDIVRAHNPWHEVAEELPPKGAVINRLSIVVWCTDGKRKSIGRYDYANGDWFTDDDFTPTHWAYLPEAKP